jgi:hypothetical protein
MGEWCLILSFTRGHNGDQNGDPASQSKGTFACTFLLTWDVLMLLLAFTVFACSTLLFKEII